MLHKKVLHSDHAVASVGYAIADNGRLICHRASTGHGMAGSAATGLEASGLLRGIHIGSAGHLSLPHCVHSQVAILNMPPCEPNLLRGGFM